MQRRRAMADGLELLNPDTVTGLVVLHSERYASNDEWKTRGLMA